MESILHRFSCFYKPFRLFVISSSAQLSLRKPRMLFWGALQRKKREEMAEVVEPQAAWTASSSLERNHPGQGYAVMVGC
jgi:hypothetical protein